MRTLVIGDIHGCFTALQMLEREMDFTDEDQLITLGDYVDRGPHSKAVLDWLITRRNRGGKLIALKGNHEVIMMWAREDSQSQKSWMSPFVGGDATLRSYGDEQSLGLLRDVPAEHWQFIKEQTVRYHETDTHLFVHASVLPDVPMEQQKDETLFWDRFKEQPLHMSGKRVICGHTAQHDGVPVMLPHGLCIDTRAYGGGWLTCLDMATGRYGQANERGAFRTGQIDGWQ